MVSEYIKLIGGVVYGIPDPAPFPCLRALITPFSSSVAQVVAGVLGRGIGHESENVRRYFSLY